MTRHKVSQAHRLVYCIAVSHLDLPKHLGKSDPFLNGYKGKSRPNQAMKGPEGSRGIALLILNLGARRGRFSPGKDPLPIVQEAGCPRAGLEV
jgi:hypothetical protein